MPRQARMTRAWASLETCLANLLAFAVQDVFDDEVLKRLAAFDFCSFANHGGDALFRDPNGELVSFHGSLRG